MPVLKNYIRSQDKLVCVTKGMVKKYIEVQRSGITNMFDVRVVSKLSGLTREQIIAIMENYSKFKKDYKL